jgi:serine O-acetyltransferase
VNFFLGDLLRHVSYRLSKHIQDVFKYRCKKENCDNCDCKERAEQALISLIEALPEVRAVLVEDIKAALDGDPAAQSFDEVVMSYPCVEAISTYRVAHLLYTLDVPIIPRIMSERAHSRTGIDIHPGATIGPRFFIDHGTGVVIGETCTIGSNVKIYQGVTLGALSPFDKDGRPAKGVKRHPDIEDGAIIYANATILGGKTVIGKGAIIGGNTWITASVAPGAKVSRQNEANGKQ